MFTNTNIHDELGDDFTGATAMSNAEVKIALAHNRAQAPGWLCVNQRSAVAAALREAGENQLAAAAAAALPDTPPHYR